MTNTHRNTHIIREYFKNCMPANWQPGKMDKFWETYNLSKLKQEEIENLNRLITSNEFESVIKKQTNKQVLTNKVQEKMTSWVSEFYKSFKEELKS